MTTKDDPGQNQGSNRREPAEAPKESGQEDSPPAEASVRRRRGNRRAGSPGPKGLLPETAKEDDPRVWGDGPEDRDSWLLEQRPPHWG